MRRLYFMGCLAILLHTAACGPTGMPSRKETWNSYYYGATPKTELGIAYHDTQESDDLYRLPRGYDTSDSAQRAANARTPSHNLIFPNNE